MLGSPVCPWGASPLRLPGEGWVPRAALVCQPLAWPHTQCQSVGRQAGERL